MANVQFRALKSMAKEQYVTVETAKMLSKYGFEWECRCYYYDGQRYEHCHQEILPKDKKIYPCPTQAMTMQWLREQYHIAVTPVPYRYPNKWDCILVYLGEPMEKDDKYDIFPLENIQPSYEAAAEAGIQYVLKSIIAPLRKRLNCKIHIPVISKKKN